MRLLLFLTALCCLIGCVEESGPSKNPDPNVPVGSTCTIGNDCATGHFCLFLGGQGKCTSCPRCPDGEQCAEPTGECVPKQACEGPNSCPLNQHCFDGFCEQGCLPRSLEGCCFETQMSPRCSDDLFECTENQQCIVRRSCDDPSECPDEYTCIDHQCILPISSSPR